MPIYTFRDTQSGEVFDISMTIKDYDEYKKTFPNHERYFDEVPALVSGSSSSLRTDDGFKEVLSRVAEAHPNSALADQHLRKSVKQVKTERALKKWRSSQA